MNLFEKIDLFEKMAMQLTEDEFGSGSKAIENINEFDDGQTNKDSINARTALLKNLFVR